MVGLLPFTDADGVATTLRLRDVETLLRSKRTAMRPVLQREGCPEFGEEAALAFHVYTLERPFRIYAIVNGQQGNCILRTAAPAPGPGVFTDDCFLRGERQVTTATTKYNRV